MRPATSGPGTARFGPYEVDSHSGEVKKFGTRIKLGEQPLRILIRLMERPGELVTREELRSLLWSENTFVDFEHGLNSAVQRLRDTLSDTAEEAQWIETVPRRGYRFAGKVEWSKGNDSLAAVSGRVMLAVLPFENLSGDPGQDYFSDGLTEEMIAQLGALSPEHLGVISRTSSMVYKHTSKSARQIGSELGTDYVLESSLRRDGERVRITVQLIRVRDQVHLWANNYDSHISSSIALQEEVARAVAEQIEVKLSSVYANRPVRSHPDSAANEAYLRGRFFFNQFTSGGYYKAIEYFQQAIDRDPNFAEA